MDVQSRQGLRNKMIQVYTTDPNNKTYIKQKSPTGGSRLNLSKINLVFSIR